MSDPYGNNPYGQNPGSQNPGGQNPGGQNPGGPPPGPPNPYGPPSGGGYGGGYGPPPGGYPGGFDPMPPKTDGMSIAALVLSFLCCLAPVGVILGFVGLSRTKGGKRKGRGLAIAAIIVGILMTLATAAAFIVLVVLADKIVTPGNAEVGQCVNVKKEDGSIFLYKKDCTDEHDAEIVGIAKVTDENLSAIETGMVSYCLEAIDEADRDKIAPYLADLDAVIEDPEDVSKGDTLVCYVHPDDKLDKSIL